MKSLFAFVLVILSAVLVADVKAQCDDGWKYWQRDNKCIKLFDQKGLSWKDAMYKCLEEEGRLVTIHDKATQEFVNNLVKNLNSFYWIGLADFKNGKQFKWVDGTTLLGFSNWGRGQPDSIGDEDCGHLRPDLKWNDLYCGSVMNKYICEKRGPGCKYENGGCPDTCNEKTTSEWKVSCSKRCDPGYAEVQSVCYDIDECSVNNGSCDQYCRNEAGTYSCECQAGYEYTGMECVSLAEESD